MIKLYLVKSFSLEYLEFNLSYNLEGGVCFDKWEWNFTFTGNNDVDSQIEKAKNILDVIE